MARIHPGWSHVGTHNAKAQAWARRIAWLWLGIAAGAHGEGSPGRVAHEDLPGAAAAAPAAMPAAIDVGPALVAAPSALDAPTLSTRPASVAPDRITRADEELRYDPVFSPDVIPYKRGMAFDSVDASYRMQVAAGHQTEREVPVGGPKLPGREVFWAAFRIELAPGQSRPMPSVAPDMGIQAIQSTPPATWRVVRDGADNFALRLVAGPAGPFALRLLVDAPSGYFSGALPALGISLAAHRKAIPAALRVALPSAVQAKAQRMLARLGISETTDRRDAVLTLARYFRAFVADRQPGQTGDVYLDLCEAQAGVCRHRAFGFLVTALAAGVPTRYVANEAHAFVEVWLAPEGWRRIDLGGAASRLLAPGSEARPRHRPAMGRLAAPPPPPVTSVAGTAGHGGQAEGASGGGSGPQASDARVTPDATAPMTPYDPRRATPSIEILRVDRKPFRSETMNVEGRVTVDRHAPLQPMSVTISLAPAGGLGKNAVEIGRTTTNDQGAFAAVLVVPPSLPIATYEVFASTPPDSLHNAAVSK